MGAGNDILLTNANISSTDKGAFIDGGDGDDIIKFATTGSASFSASTIKNFESAEQVDGTWDYDGDYKTAGVKTITISGGTMHLTDSDASIFEDVVMTGGTILADISDKTSAPLTADSFEYKPSNAKMPPQLIVQAGSTTDPEGTYVILDVPETSQSEMNELAANSTLIYDDEVGEFSGIGEENGIEGTANFDVYMVEGSLNVQVDAKSAPEIDKDLNNIDPSDPDLGLDDDEQELVEIIQDGGPGADLIDSLLPDVIENIELPIISYGTLGKLFVSGFGPRNIDGAGRGMATYNNLLTDVVFERLPLRQFDPVVVEKTVVEQEEVIEESAPPVRGLWNKSGEVSDQQAQQALDQAIAQAEVTGETTIESLEASGFIEDTSLTAQYARRDGVRAWFRGFGGDDHDSYNDNFYNPYYVNAGGGVLGVDVSVTDNFQIGAFANYGNINLIQQNTLAGGGSWNSDGWGGGVKADYWTDNFYVQGLFSATGFSGNQKREIIEITDQLGDDTASGDKSATSYGLAFRLGAPFEAGKFVLEPQFTTTWSFNNEHQFTESGAGQLNLTYKERSTTYVQTDLAMKFSYPINTGETSQLVPSLRVGWLGDWSGNLSDQTLGYRFTNKEANIKSANEDTNGVLVEGGLDYTIANVNSSSYKVYFRGGIEAWGGARGTDYRASGGFEWQF
ncbi:Outer membrane autotransporter barrel [Synechococcus sp. RS9916]|nr:Outer membrane autotransporter barrel [Synechococcus sp. RS9916]